MEFQVGQHLKIDGRQYTIIGKIRYVNEADGCSWEEYRMIAAGMGREQWLSIDNTYREYSISTAAFQASTFGYHEVDRGRERVDAVWGDVDVEVGDRAEFIEYEDSSEEKIISIECWDDGNETSTGYYLDVNEIQLIDAFDNGIQYGTYQNGFSGAATYYGNNRQGFAAMQQKSQTEKNRSNAIALFIVAILFMPVVFGIPAVALSSGSKKINSYLDKSANFTYVTSITGNQNQKEKANVYESPFDLDTTAKYIIDELEGEVESIQQNTDDGDQSIAILTRGEYCFIYSAEEGYVLVQVSSRKYAYAEENEPYHSRPYSRRFYRRYYYSRGYQRDRSRYKKYTTSYDSFDDSMLNPSYTDRFHDYSNSVRQESARRRQAQGGGMSYGK